MSKPIEMPGNILTITEAPNESLEKKWNALHGINHHKRLLLQYSLICMDRTRLESWCNRYYPNTEGIPELVASEIGFSGKVMLRGDAGTGKTCIAEGLADAVSKTMGKVYLIKLGLLRSKYVGFSVRRVIRAFEYVKEKAKEAWVILFIDEFDSVAPNRNNHEMHEEVKASVNKLLEEIENVTPSDRVLVIAATNLYDQAVDFAVDRRFDMIIDFRRPSFQQRLDLLTILLKQFRIDTENLVLLTKETRGYTPADIKKVIKHSLVRCLISGMKLTAADLLRSLKYVTPTRRYDGEKEFE
jgi:AAA+ superfamily predicted ATPase